MSRRWPVNPCRGVRYVAESRAGEPVVKMPDDAVLKEATESTGYLRTGMEGRGVVLVRGKSDVTFLKACGQFIKTVQVRCQPLWRTIVPVTHRRLLVASNTGTLNLWPDLELLLVRISGLRYWGDPARVLSIQKRKVEGGR